MTNEEMNLEVAKTVGLRIVESPYHSVLGHTLDGKTYLNLPDYTGDLNAIHKVIMSKWDDAKFRVMYSSALYGICNHSDIDVCVATPTQRAKAFLCVIGKLP